jgi:hypothetical protein
MLSDRKVYQNIKIKSELRRFAPQLAKEID